MSIRANTNPDPPSRNGSFPSTPSPLTPPPPPVSDDRQQDTAEQTSVINPVEASMAVFEENQDVDVRFRGARVPARKGSSLEGQSRANQKIHGRTSQTLPQSLQDPLLTRPRHAVTVWAAILGVIMLVAAACLWCLAVCTMEGQEFDNLVWSKFRPTFETHIAWLSPLVIFCTTPVYVVGTICVVTVIGVLIALIRRRWVLVLQQAILGIVAGVSAYLLKHFLPRPVYGRTVFNPANTSPSGHSTAIFTACIILLLAVGLSWRWVALFISFVLTSIVGVSLVIGRWHRPSDVVVAFFMVTGMALIDLAFTRGSGMDKPGKRRSSTGIQIVATIMLVTGAAGLCYAGYLVSQVLPGLQYMAQWTVRPAIEASVMAILSSSMLGMSLVAIFRQLTASPLSPVGLIGPPPEPASNH
ncbi:MAG: hypothetical protein U0K19_05305 [Bifidobacteriaceae bacterium]|nr:hypothetical protein [Bifidobacteriaceae bacterium]